MKPFPQIMTAARSSAPFVLAAALSLLLEKLLLFTEQQALLTILIAAGINVILAVSLNIVNGMTGQFSLGHAGFMAVGAYTAAKITMALRELADGYGGFAASDDAMLAIGLLAGMVAAAIAGLLVGLPSLRLRGDYLAIVTLGFNEILRVIIENTPALGMATGISGVPKLSSLTWVGIGAAITIIAARRLAGSTHGRALLAIREDEIAAEAMGVDTTEYKVRAFVMAAAFAGLAGGLLVHVIQLCTPRSFGFVKSIEIVVMVVLGGMGSLTGSVFAALGLSFALEGLREFQQYRMAVFALLLIILMLVRPTGLFGRWEIWDWWRKRKGRCAADVLKDLEREQQKLEPGHE